jgi:UDP-N-acetylglucosamine acyltransferase
MGDYVSLANCVQIGGHVHVGDQVTIGGLTAVHQFARIGDYAMIGGGSVVLKDVPPYAMASGNKLRLYNLNRRGLQRAGFNTDTIREIKHAYHTLFRAGLPLAQALEQIRSFWPGDEVQSLIRFIEESERGVTR